MREYAGRWHDGARCGLTERRAVAVRPIRRRATRTWTASRMRRRAATRSGCLGQQPVRHQSFPGAPPDRCGDGKTKQLSRIQLVPMTPTGRRHNADADCDDNDKNTHPWAAELCDGKDNDCDGIIDEPKPGRQGRSDGRKSPVTNKNVIMSCTDFCSSVSAIERWQRRD